MVVLSKKYIKQFILIRVQKSTQAPLEIQYTRSFASLFIRAISIKYRLLADVTISSFVAYEIFNYTTSKLVTDMHDAESDTGQLKSFQRLDDPSYQFSKVSSWKIQMNSLNQNPNFMPQSSELIDPSSLILIGKSQFNKAEPGKTITCLLTYLHNTKV